MKSCKTCYWNIDNAICAANNILFEYIKSKKCDYYKSRKKYRGDKIITSRKNDRFVEQTPLEKAREIVSTLRLYTTQDAKPIEMSDYYEEYIEQLEQQIKQLEEK